MSTVRRTARSELQQQPHICTYKWSVMFIIWPEAAETLGDSFALAGHYEDSHRKSSQLLPTLRWSLFLEYLTDVTYVIVLLRCVLWGKALIDCI